MKLKCRTSVSIRYTTVTHTHTHVHDRNESSHYSKHDNGGGGGGGDGNGATAANIEFVHCSRPFSTCQFSCKFIVLLMGSFALCEYMVWAIVRCALAHVLHAKIASGVFSDGIETWRNLR